MTHEPVNVTLDIASYNMSVPEFIDWDERPFSDEEIAEQEAKAVRTLHERNTVAVACPACSTKGPRFCDKTPNCRMAAGHNGGCERS